MNLAFPKRRNFYMLRHAQTDDNLNKMVSGAGRQAMLTDHGKKQVIAIQPIIANLSPAFDYIVTSEMQRTKDTAKILCEYPILESLQIYVDSGINERAYGAAEGISDAERNRLINDGIKIEGEETKENLRTRVISAVAGRLNQMDGIPLFITHGGVVRRIMELAIGAEPAKKEKVANCGLYWFITPETENGDWHFEKLCEGI